MEAAAARLAAYVDYRGILDLDFRLDPETGSYHLLDFNPRPGAQFRLFTDDAGVDVVRAQHLHLTGRQVPAQLGGPGRVFVAENYALLSAAVAGASRVRDRDRDRILVRARAGGRDGRVERAWFSAEDPAPFFAMAGTWFARCLRKSWQHLAMTVHTHGRVRVRSIRPGLPPEAPSAPLSAPLVTSDQ